MSDGTSIEWADASCSPIRALNRENARLGWFCTHVSDGCSNCYSETLNRRLGTRVDYRAQDRSKVELYLDEKILRQPLRWKRGRRIFWNSMSDTFGEFVPDKWIDRIMAVAALTPQHQHLFLTKRAERMRDYLSDQEARGDGLCRATHRLVAGRDPGEAPPWPLPQVWAGVSVEDQRRADERIPLLLDTPAAVRWISYEPALEHIDIGRYLRRMVVRANEELTERMIEGGWSHPGGQGDHPGISWLICGGESGPGARPFDLQWARSVIAQCGDADVRVFCKQIGSNPWLNKVPFERSRRPDRKGGAPEEWPADIRIREYPAGR